MLAFRARWSRPPGGRRIPLMRKTKCCGSAILSAAVLMALGRYAGAQVTYTTIDLNPAGYADSYGLSIAGSSVAGYGSTSADAHTNYHAFLLDRTTGALT